MWKLAVVTMTTAFGQPDVPACSWVQDGSEFLRGVEDTWVEARVLSDTVRASLHPERVSTTRGEPVGHFVELDESIGHASDDAAAKGSRVAVFLWSVGPSCRWHTRGAELELGSIHHFPLRLRPRAMWSDDIPTFDVVPTSGLDVFPGRRKTPDVDWEEYRELVSLIPVESDWRRDCRPFLEPLRHWRDATPGRFSGLVVSRLWGSCENVIRSNGVRLERQGPFEVPARVITWSERAGCEIRTRWDQSLDAVVGTYEAGSDRRSWAVICVTDSHSRLVVIDEASGEQEAELLRVAGPAYNWFLSVVPPEYFEWIRFGETVENPEGRTPPDADAIALRGWMRLTFALQDGAWTGYQATCCSGRELRMPRER